MITKDAGRMCHSTGLPVKDVMGIFASRTEAAPRKTTVYTCALTVCVHCFPGTGRADTHTSPRIFT